MRGMAQAVRQVYEWFAHKRLINLVRPVPPPMRTSAAPRAELPAHVGATVTTQQVRDALRTSASAREAMAQLRKLTNRKAIARDDDALRELLKSLRTLSQELPIDRRLEAPVAKL